MKKQIETYENYFIYDNGDVFNDTTKRFLKGTIGENGYKYYRLSKNNNKKMFYAHRLVAKAFIENPNKFPIVNHLDGNKLNNNKEDLEWSTYSNNITHAHANNLIKPSRKREYYDDELKGEIWKEIPFYNYSVSNPGRVRNNKTLLILKPSLICGYYKVRLSKKGKVVDFLVHHLVYCTFNKIEKISKDFVIDHINSNKTDNSLNNLKLVTLSDNVKSALYETKTNPSCKEVEQLTLQDKHIGFFNSCAAAAKNLGLDCSSISKVCRGENKSYGGFHFRYTKKQNFNDYP